MCPRIIGITGHARSGKTCAARYLHNKYGMEIRRNSAPIGELAVNLACSGTRDTYAEIATALLDVFGRDLVARHWLSEIEKHDINSIVVIEGIRYQEELDFYREKSDFSLLGIESTDACRFDRSKIAEDSEKDLDASLSEFVAKKQQRNESQIDELVNQADVVVDNNASLDEFYSSIDRAIDQIIA